MKHLLMTALITATTLWAGAAFAAGADCATQATEKKLAGAAKSSFLKKCQKDSGAAPMAAASPACEKSAADKKLAGAAKSSHIKKCTADAAAKS